MKIHVNLLVDNSLVTEKMKERLIEAAGMVLRDHGLRQGELGFILAGDEYLRQLNCTYRGLDQSTDVLTFFLLDKEELDLLKDRASWTLLGDVYISLEKAAEQARFRGRSFQEELLQLAVHGVLHLLGYDHAGQEEETLMREKEKIYLDSLL